MNIALVVAVIALWILAAVGVAQACRSWFGSAFWPVFFASLFLPVVGTLIVVALSALHQAKAQREWEGYQRRLHALHQRTRPQRPQDGPIMPQPRARR